MTSTVLLLLPHLLSFSQAAPEPDTHLHVHLPPEEGQGLNSFLCFFFLMSFLQGGKTPNTGAGGLATNGLKWDPHIILPAFYSPIWSAFLSCSQKYYYARPIFTFCPSVRCPSQSWHPTFSHLYDPLDHTNQIFSESLWHPLSTDQQTTHTSPLLTNQTNSTRHFIRQRAFKC